MPRRFASRLDTDAVMRVLKLSFGILLVMTLLLAYHTRRGASADVVVLGGQGVTQSGQVAHPLRGPAGAGSAEGAGTALEGASRTFTVVCNDAEDEFRNMHAVVAGIGEPVFVLVHGGSRLQTSQHWAPIESAFTDRGSFVAVDMLGHGKSDEAGVASQPRALAELVKDVLDARGLLSTRQLILVGRSWGGGIVNEALQYLHPYVRAIILIAPSISGRPSGDVPRAFLDNVPTLLVWAKDDQVVSFRREERVRRIYKSATLLAFDSVLDGELPTFMSHMPELVKADEFRAGVDELVRATDRA